MHFKLNDRITWNGREATVIRTSNENILGLKVSEAIVIQFDDGTRKMLLNSQLEGCSNCHE